MNIHSRKELHSHGLQAVANASGNPGRIALVYGGIICAMGLGGAVLSDILRVQIAETGGLSNMGMRSVLATIQYILPIVQMIVMLSLELGYCQVGLNLSRGQRTNSRTLLAGFRRFGPMLRTVLFMGLILMGIGIGAMYLSTYIFLMLPVSGDFLEAAQPLVDSMSMLNSEVVMDEATMLVLAEKMIPMLWIFAAVFALAAVPLLYHFRMVNFCLLDMPRPGALAAMGQSRLMMRRNRFALFRLDLSFWWYYLLEGLVTLVAYGDVLLPMAGVRFPWSDTVGYYLFYTLSLVLQMVVYYFFLNRVQATYAAAYDVLRLQAQPPQDPACPPEP